MQEVPGQEEGKTAVTGGKEDIAVDDTQRRLQTLLDYWIEHNGEHEQEFRDWAGKAAPLSAEVAKQLQKAAIKMASVSDELQRAKQALAKGKGGR
jgi:hypothetical protein